MNALSIASLTWLCAASFWLSSGEEQPPETHDDGAPAARQRSERSARSSDQNTVQRSRRSVGLQDRWSNELTGQKNPSALGRSRNQSHGSTSRASSRRKEGGQGLTILDPEIYESEDVAPLVPEFHVVSPGDTLWGITAEYYRDPYQWPKLWSYNEQITNAHWIFPGDRLRVRQGSQPTTGPRASEQPASGFSYVDSKRGAKTPSRYLVQRNAFLLDVENEKRGEVLGATRPAVMLATGDEVFISYDHKQPPVSGERLAVYRPMEPVYDIRRRFDGSTGRGKRLGYLVEVVGEIDVGKIDRKSAVAQISGSTRVVERGMWVGELKPRYLRLRSEEATVDRGGHVVRCIDGRDMGGEGQFVVINLGQKAGARRGNVLEVVRRGDATARINQREDSNHAGHPRRVVATMVVVDTTPESSMAMVVDSRFEILPGDPVELRRPSGGKKVAAAGMK